MAKKQYHFEYGERRQLEALLRHHIPVSQIAVEMGFTRQSIYREIKRGNYIHTNTNLKEETRYSADKGQDIHEKAKRNKGRELKIGKDIAFADFLEDLILHHHYSPAAALAEAKAKNFTTSICLGTLYNYITMGLFVELEDKHLLEKATRKPRKKDEEPQIVHKNLPSIEIRPEIINNREEYGHWEMDLVVGPQGTKPCLLTMTERKSLEEIIILLPNRQAATVRRAIDRLERNTPYFRQKFKSITTDNGSEFMEYELLIKSCRSKKQRFDIYYCHSYAAWEKGRVENQNRIIRRFFPKGTDFTNVTRKQVAAVQAWMNNYPRKSLEWETPLKKVESMTA